jgi:hypothetical protein
MLVVLLSALSSAMWGISRRLNNTRQVPAPRAFVSDQTGLVEERRDACDLSHLCCFASGTQGSGGALTRHRLVHGARSSCSCVLRCFQRSYSVLVASACASGHSKGARSGSAKTRSLRSLSPCWFAGREGTPIGLHRSTRPGYVAASCIMISTSSGSPSSALVDGTNPQSYG